MATKLKRVTIWLTQGHHFGLQRVAVERGISTSRLLRRAAIEMLEDEEDIREGQRAIADVRGTVAWEQYKRRKKDRGS